MYTTEQQLEFLGRANAAWKFLYIELSKIRQEIVKAPDVAQSCDVLLILKKAHDAADDIRKEINKVAELIERILCLQWTAASVGEPLRGKLCTASPRPGIAVTIPKRAADPIKFDSIMEHFGISREVSEKELVRIHWPAVQELIENLNLEGRPMPACFAGLKEYDIFKVTCRPAKGIDLEALTIGAELPPENQDTIEQVREFVERATAAAVTTGLEKFTHGPIPNAEINRQMQLESCAAGRHTWLPSKVNWLRTCVGCKCVEMQNEIGEFVAY